MRVLERMHFWGCPVCGHRMHNMGQHGAAQSRLHVQFSQALASKEHCNQPAGLMQITVPRETCTLKRQMQPATPGLEATSGSSLKLGIPPAWCTGIAVGGGPMAVHAARL
jgi:hypothetical protein